MKLKLRLLAIFCILAGVLTLFSALALNGCGDGDPPLVSEEYRRSFEKTYEKFLKEQNLLSSDYPDSLLNLLRRNPETEDFVLNYPLLKDKAVEIDLSEYKDSDSIPYFQQWDKRWGYKKYGSDVMGLTGCGPTCLSMVAIYLLNDTAVSPAYVADFSAKNGFCVEGHGSSWNLMSVGAEMLGLYSEELPLHENTIKKHLGLGHPVICAMGQGDFTSSGHFIVMTEYFEGKIRVLDPNSLKNTEKLWDYEQIAPQIRNLWALSKQ